MMLTMTYASYVILVVLITISVARTLSKNGAVFLVDGFGGDEALANSINHLLVVGFYLINLGFALLQLQRVRDIGSTAEALVFLSSKIGFVLLVVGVMHFFNLLAISMFKSAQTKRQRAIKNHEIMQREALCFQAEQALKEV